MTAQTQNFTADVSRLLGIVAGALYTNHDVFLRELISNAADACDRLRYEAITQPALTADNPAFRIHVYKDTDTRTLTVVDNGIGMSAQDMADHLGTIARSGTAAVMESMKGADDALKLIGQFGVGFYAGFMVATKIAVTSRRAGSSDISTWESDGQSGFTVRAATDAETARLDGARGTAVVLNLKDEASEFLIDEKIRQTVEQYSNHIDVPVYPGKPGGTADQPLNSASALWIRPKADITKAEYDDFYRNITHGFDEPLMTSHWRAEGKIEYAALLFIPTLRPWDLYDPSRRNAVKLYVRRVFISDNVPDLMYPWLRFVRGVVDSSDLPLNISRETLQHNLVIQKMRSGMTRRVLADLNRLAQDDTPAFIAFWGQFGAVVKEGLYDAVEHREDIFKVCRFYSTHDDGEKFTSLADYVARMKGGQDSIYYISGEKLSSLRHAPQIEALKAQGYEVLFFTDTIDDFWAQQAHEFQGKSFKSVTKGDIAIDADGQNAPVADAGVDALLTRMGDLLRERVAEVRLSKRLRESPVCLVAADHGVDIHMERVLKVQQKYQGGAKPSLEINGEHALIKKLAGMAANDPAFDDAVHLLYDQALIIHGEPVEDAGAFARRLSALMTRAV